MASAAPHLVSPVGTALMAPADRVEHLVQRHVLVKECAHRLTSTRATGSSAPTSSRSSALSTDPDTSRSVASVRQPLPSRRAHLSTYGRLPSKRPSHVGVTSTDALSLSRLRSRTLIAQSS